MNLIKKDPDLKIIKIYGLELKKLDKYNLVLYILMELAWCELESELKNRSQKNQKLSEKELVTLLSNLVQTLSKLQQIGICHRDIKPSNILCFHNGILIWYF